MKKKLIGLSVCMMLVAISFIPNITADEKTESMLSLSEEEYDELNEKILKFNDQLLAAATIEQVENVIRDIVVFLDDYGFLAEDTKIDEEVALLKNAYLEQIQCQSGEIIAGEATVQEECFGSEINMGQSLLFPTGWVFLTRFPNPRSWGYRIIGWTTDEMAYSTKNFNKKRVSGYSSPAILIIRDKLEDDNGNKIRLSLDYVYLTFGFGTFDITCRYRTDDLELHNEWLGTASVEGFKVNWISGPLYGGYLNSEQQQIQGQQSSEQLIGTTQQYTTGSTTNN